MKWTEIPAGELHAAEQRLRVALNEEAGNVVKRINTDPALANLIAGQIIAMTKQFPDKMPISANPQWLRAREIMDKNFFGVEEAIEFFGINPTKNQLFSLSLIPFSESVLEETRRTHILVAIFPLSIIEIREKLGKKDYKIFGDEIYNKVDQPYFAKRGELKWQLIKKTMALHSGSKYWLEQLSLLDKNEEVPEVQALVYAVCGHYLATGEALFGNDEIVRTSSVFKKYQHKSFGTPFSYNGRYTINSYWDGDRLEWLGIVSAKKPM